MRFSTFFAHSINVFARALAAGIGELGFAIRTHLFFSNGRTCWEVVY